MMKPVGVISTAGGTIETSGGVKGSIGDGRVAAGDVLWSFGDFVFSPGQQGSRPPIIWRRGGGNVFLAKLSDGTYALVTVNLSAATAATEPVTLPSAPLAHCHSDGEDYVLFSDKILRLSDSHEIALPDGDAYGYFNISNIGGTLTLSLADYGADGSAEHGKSYTLDLGTEAWTEAESSELRAGLAGETSRAVAICPTGAEAETRWGTSYVPQFDGHGSAFRAYNSSATYAADSICTYDFRVWKSLTSNTGNTPTEGTYWTQVGWVLPYFSGDALFGTVDGVEDRRAVTYAAASAIAEEQYNSYASPDDIQIGSDGDLICQITQRGYAVRYWDIVIGGVNYGHSRAAISPLVKSQPVYAYSYAVAQAATVDGSEVARVQQTGTTIAMSTTELLYMYNIGANLFVGDLVGQNNGLPIYALGNFCAVRKYTNSTSQAENGDATWFGGDIFSGFIRDDYHGNYIDDDYSGEWYDRESVAVDGVDSYDTVLTVVDDGVVYLDGNTGQLMIGETELLEDVDTVYTHGESGA